MARSFLLSALVTRCQQRCGMEGSDHVTSTELKGLISSAYGQLYMLFVSSGYPYFQSEQTMDSDGSTALPSDYLATIGVDYVESGGQRHALDLLMAQERNIYTGTTTGARAWAYAVNGTNVLLYPTPPTGQSYKHVYVPQPTELSGSSDSTSVDVVSPDGEEYIVSSVAVMALAKEESDTSVHERAAARAWARLEDWAQRRALNSPRRQVVDDGPYFADEADWRFR